MEEISVTISTAPHPELGPEFEEALEADISKFVAAQLDAEGHAMNAHWAVISTTTGKVALASKNFECYTVLDNDFSLVPGPNFRVLAKRGDWIELDNGNDNSDEFHIIGKYTAVWLGAGSMSPKEHDLD